MDPNSNFFCLLRFYNFSHSNLYEFFSQLMQFSPWGTNFCKNFIINIYILKKLPRFAQASNIQVGFFILH